MNSQPNKPAGAGRMPRLVRRSERYYAVVVKLEPQDLDQWAVLEVFPMLAKMDAGNFAAKARTFTGGSLWHTARVVEAKITFSLPNA